MTKRLLLMRHAKSDWSTPGTEDRDRPLNPRGKLAAPLMGNWLATQSCIPDLVLCSTAVRTRETVKLILESWCDCASNPPVQYFEELYLASPSTIWQLFKQITAETPSLNTVLIVGHNPGLEMLASELNKDSIEMPTAAVIHFHWPSSTHWEEVRKCDALRVVFQKPKEL